MLEEKEILYVSYTSPDGRTFWVAEVWNETVAAAVIAAAPEGWSAEAFERGEFKDAPVIGSVEAP